MIKHIFNTLSLIGLFPALMAFYVSHNSFIAGGYIALLLITIKLNK